MKRNVPFAQLLSLHYNRAAELLSFLAPFSLLYCHSFFGFHNNKLEKSGFFELEQREKFMAKLSATILLSEGIMQDLVIFLLLKSSFLVC